MTSLARAADLAPGRQGGRAGAALRGARTFLVWALLGVGLALALTLLLPLAFHGRPLTVMSGSMEPAIMTGDVVIAMPVAPLDVRPGDIVSFNDPGRGGKLVTHRVRSLRRSGGDVDFVTKGDANNSVEKWRIRADRQIGRTVLRLPRLGHALIFARTRTGLLVLVLLPLLVLGVLEMASIWRPDAKDGAGPQAP
jgi:signal peptidase